jgi:cobalt-zinc-cadmium efflux system protein
MYHQGHDHGHRGHDHDHGHHHHAIDKDLPTYKLWISILLNLVITLAQFIGGLVSNSLALLSDAAHNLNDTLSLGIALYARKIGQKKADSANTFGYKRAEIIGAFINLITLIIIALVLIKEGIERFMEPVSIDGSIMLWVAVIGLLGNVVTAILLHSQRKENLNMKSAYLHILSDAFSSVGVILGGWLILYYQWYWVDSVLTIAIGIYILFHSYHMLRESIDILMEATPGHISLPELENGLKKIDLVEDIHHLHIWNLNESQTLLECHVRIDESNMHCIERIKKAIKDFLSASYNIHHSTLEFEWLPCADKHSDCR